MLPRRRLGELHHQGHHELRRGHRAGRSPPAVQLGAGPGGSGPRPDHGLDHGVARQAAVAHLAARADALHDGLGTPSSTAERGRHHDLVAAWSRARRRPARPAPAPRRAAPAAGCRAQLPAGRRARARRRACRARARSVPWCGEPSVTRRRAWSLPPPSVAHSRRPRRRRSSPPRRPRGPGPGQRGVDGHAERPGLVVQVALSAIGERDHGHVAALIAQRPCERVEGPRRPAISRHEQHRPSHRLVDRAGRLPREQPQRGARPAVRAPRVQAPRARLDDEPGRVGRAHHIIGHRAGRHPG